MATLQEKTSMIQIEQVDNAHAKARIEELEVPSVALAAALRATKPNWLSGRMFTLYYILGMGYLVSSIAGFDGSLMGSINAMKEYQKTFNMSSTGSTTGIVFIVYNLGQLASIPVCSLVADGWGRRKCIFIGCVIVVLGTVIQVTANTRGHFIGGRFVLGLGASIACSVAPAYTIEMAYPSVRGTMAGMYNNFWWVGNILASWTTYGSNKNIHDSWAWRLPTLLQCVLPAIVAVNILFCPESPRWLISKNRIGEAEAFFAKYHGNGDRNAPIVRLQMAEIKEDLADTTDDKPWWNYTDLVSSKAKRYRLMLVIAVAFFGQWSGNNVVSYFLPEMMQIAGITSTNKQLLINSILSIFGMSSAVVGATMLDRLGRRLMLLICLSGCLFSYVLLTAFTAEATHVSNLSYGTIVSVFLFIGFFAWAFTPLQTLYPVEVLENRTRVKGSAQNTFWLNVAMIVNTYGISVGMEKIGWKLYLVFIAWIVLEIVFVYFLFVETKAKTLEELRVVFEARNPVKESLKKESVRLDGSGNVIAVGDDV